jgi:hypothetical protein
MSTIKTNAIQTVAGKPILNSTGSILQVVQTVKTDTFFTSSTSYVEVTGLSASITPSSSSNKILVFVDIKGWAQNSQVGGFQLLRNATAIYIGDVAGSRQQVSIGGMYPYQSSSNVLTQGLACYVDSPATTSAVTYKLQCRTLNVGIYVNRQAQDTNDNDNPRGASSITLMEISG